MKKEDRTIPLDTLLVSFSIASHQVEHWIRKYGATDAEVMCRGLAENKGLPRDYRVAFQTAFGG